MEAQDDLQTRWWKLEGKFIEKFGKKPDVETILFLIGKQDLMHVAVCTLLGQSGYYKTEGFDEDGWPHFIQLKALPEYNMTEQENFLKDHILLYFENIGEPFQKF